MSLKYKWIIFFWIFLFVQIKLFANPLIKGETTFNLVSPLLILQEKDSLEIKYDKVKKLYSKEEYSQSLEKSLILLDKAIKNENFELEFLCVFLIGEIYSKLNKQKKAILYFDKSLVLLKKKESLIDLSLYDEDFNRLNSRAKTFLKLGTEYAKLQKIDSAKYFYKKVIEIETFDTEFLSIKASAYNNLSGVAIRDSLYGLAKDYSVKAIAIRRKTKNKIKEAAALGNLASIYLSEKDYKTAKSIYKEALSLIEKDNSSTAFRYKKSLYFNLAWTLYNLEDFTAYDYQEKSYIIKDSLRNAEFEHIVQQVYEKYQFDIAKKQANKAESNVKLKELEEKRTTIFFIILIVLLVVISGVILYNYKLRQNNLKLKLSQTQFAQKSKLEKLKSESQVRILNATLDGKETERKQIAETLHDSVSSLLSSANLHLQATKMQFNGDSPIEIDKTQKIIIEASQTIRDLSHTLVSSVLLKFGLKYAIKDMAEKYSNSQMQINTDIKNLRRYHQNFEIKVNNIIQEFVNNTLKHSKASKAIVRIEDTDGKLIINIQDNGVGFDKKEIPEKDGLGINQIDARIQMMKGEFNIDSNSDNGTKIAIVLPILEKEIPIRV